MNRVPAVRFEGFTDPWEQRKLSSIATSFDYGLNAAATEYDGRNKYLRITDIDDVTHEFLKSDLTTPLADLAMSADYLLKEGDLLFARTGASVGKTYLYRQFDGMVYFAGFLIRARISEGADPEFVYQTTLTDTYKKYVAITSQRSGQPGVNAQEYADYQLMLPSKTEQQQIGMTLRSLDSLITLHQRKYEKLCVVKKSLLDKMFPKPGELYPEIRFEGFTDPWEQRKLGELISELSSGKSVNSEKGVVGPSDIGVLKTSCVSYDTFDPNECKRVVESEVGMVACPVEAVTLIVSRMNTPDRVGACGFVPDDRPNLFLPDRLWKVRLTSEANPYLVFVLLVSDAYKARLKGMASGTSGSMHNIPKDSFRDLYIVLPKGSKEQRAIGTLFARLDSLITLHQRKLELLKNLKAACLDKMFV